MHTIERYGIVALLFLVVTVVAVLMWDGGKQKKEMENVAGTTAVPAAVHGLEQPGAAERNAARRLRLVADAEARPLQRQPEGELQPPASTPASDAEPSLPGTEGVHPPAIDPPPHTGTPREEPARDPVVGRAPVPATHAYSVRAGDTLSEIAQRELGSARRWQEIVAANPGLEPARLRAGKTIQIPGARAASAQGPAPESGKAPASETRTWTVGKGENLWKIAARALGDGKRWPEIAALNPRVNPDRLELGHVLTLPSSSTAPGQKAAAKAKPAGERPTLVASTGGRQAQGRGKVK